MSKPCVGWIGLGIMGRPMAENLLRAGYPVVAFNRTSAREDPLVRAGAQPAASPRAVAEAAELVIVMVSDTADVEEVLFGHSGIAAGGKPGQIVVDMSTISPAATRTFAARLRALGVGFVDAPVSGGESGAVAATLSIMVGGDKADFERCRPILATLGQQITYLGSSGSGQAAKLCNQVMVLGNLLATCEGLLLGVASGLDPRSLIEALSGGAAASWQLENLGPKVMKRDFAPGFLVSLARKDLRLVLEAAETLRLSLPGSALVQQLFSALAAAGGEKLGTQALITAIERLNPQAGQRLPDRPK